MRESVNLANFRDLLIHRDDCYAIQRETGAYFPIDRPLRDEVLRQHLAGYMSVGTYQLRQDNTVRWVCFDLDTHDEAALACLLNCVERLLLGLGYEVDTRCCLVEKSGGKGYHVWLFLDEPLPAAQVRAWVATDFWHLWNAAEQEWCGKLECFPKQDALEPGGYGNLVKLPLGVHAVSRKRSEILGHLGAKSLDEVVRLEARLVPRYESRVVPPATAAQEVVGPSVTARLLRGEATSGSRHNLWRDFAWARRQDGMPLDLAWEWAQRLNELQVDPFELDELEKAFRGAWEKRVSIEPTTRSRITRPARGYEGGW